MLKEEDEEVFIIAAFYFLGGTFIGCRGSFSFSVTILLFCWLNTEAEYMGISHHEEVLFEMHLSEAIKKFLAIFLAL